ncbi:sensor histidine kinase [Paenibacillus qinlingensis]|uniref:histidine kinase n=1 Tax=Paenibacillus qinlingensis TaxID=1837343 RepID=A0ABU1P0R0_9BACL|nr:sensor histidine kinase [Paenibacillus qinlingensis]MDR6553154.1 two-component system sensor histidine kinase YesM [Paenibacillus qinlingensis]
MALNQWMKQPLALIPSMKLKQRFLTSYLLVCIIPLLIVSTIIYYQSAHSLEEASQEFAALYTSQIDSSMNDFIQEYDRVTKTVLIDNDLLSRLGEEKLPMAELIVNKNMINRILMRIALLKPEISNLMLVTKGNIVYHFSNTSSAVNESILLQQDWYKMSVDPEDTLFITGLHDRSYYEDKGEGAVLTVGRVLLNANGSYAGVLLIDLDPSRLLKLNENFLVARDRYDMRVIVNNKKGELVYHSDLTSGKTNWKQLSASRSTSAKEKEGMIVLTGNMHSNKLDVRTEIPREKLLLKIGNMKVSTILVTAVSLLFIMGISIAMSSYITKPIMNLRRSMKQAEAGLYLPIELRIPNDEIGSLVHSYNKMIVKIRTLIEDVYIAEIKQRQAKFLALQHQINPHMLYNTLESIRMKALVKEQDEIAGMIKILARMFRLSLGKEAHLHSVRDEVDYTVNYLQLQNIRFDDRFKLHVHMSEEVLQCRILPLVFQPIVENSINHAFHDYSKVMNLHLEGIVTEDDHIRIRISDDGAGMDPSKVMELNQRLAEAETDKLKLDDLIEATGKSIGLKNIAERIKLQYGDGYDLTVHSTEGEGTVVEFRIPTRS